MPKPAKKLPKANPKKLKTKQKAEPKPPSITTKKSYWLMLMLLAAVAMLVFGATMGIDWAETAVFAVTLVVVVGVIGYIRVNPSTLPLTRRATFLFVGASVIGFSIWAAIALALNVTGFIVQIDSFMGAETFAGSTLAMCLMAGALIGEMLGRNERVQARLFGNLDLGD